MSVPKLCNMEHILVSFFEKKTTSKPIRSIDLMELCTTDKYKDIIGLLRSYPKGSKEFCEIKKALPCYTPSIICQERRLSGIIKYTNILALDFDNVSDVGCLKRQLSELNFILYAALSCSGTGVFALVKIRDSSMYKLYFDALSVFFSELGFEIDRTCSDVTRLRFVSFDTDYYLNEDSEVWDKVMPDKVPTYCNYSCNNTDVAVKAICLVNEYVKRHMIDITIGRNNWLKIATFIAQTMGEEGKELFINISQYHPKFSRIECSRTFDSAARYHKQIGLGVFLKICRDSGIPELKTLMGSKNKNLLDKI